jgi:hypothetical protein
MGKSLSYLDEVIIKGGSFKHCHHARCLPWPAASGPLYTCSPSPWPGYPIYLSASSPSPRRNLTHIEVRGARQHNLRDVSVSIPRNTLTVVTGLSGSGKSSLAFDTIYAEGQRRYVETLSAYARQFLDQMSTPSTVSPLPSPSSRRPPPARPGRR